MNDATQLFYPQTGITFHPGANDLLISQEENMIVVELNLKHDKD